MSAVLWAVEHVHLLLIATLGGALLAALAVAAIGRDQDQDGSR